MFHHITSDLSLVFNLFEDYVLGQILTHWAAMRPSASYLFFTCLMLDGLYSSVAKLCSLMVNN